MEMFNFLETYEHLV